MNQQNISTIVPHPLSDLQSFNKSRRERQRIAAAIQKNCLRLIADANSIFVSAKQVQQTMRKLRLLKGINNAKTIEDVLGCGYLQLPQARCDGKLLYLLPAVKWTDEARTDFLGKTPMQQINFTRHLEASFLGTDTGSPLHLSMTDLRAV